MRLFSWLFGSKAPEWKPAEPTVAVAGDDTYALEVVGESFYQDALSEICGGPCEDGHDFNCIAHLVPEPDNPYDANAVAVIVNGQKVAHLTRADAIQHHRDLAALGLSGRRVSCAANINGGWVRIHKDGERDEGYFGIELDVVRPLRLA